MSYLSDSQQCPLNLYLSSNDEDIVVSVWKSVEFRQLSSSSVDVNRTFHSLS